MDAQEIAYHKSLIANGQVSRAFEFLISKAETGTVLHNLAQNYQASHKKFQAAILQGVLSHQEQEVKRSYFSSMLLEMIKWAGLSAPEICQQLLEKRKQDGELAMFLFDLRMVCGDDYLVQFIIDYPDARFLLLSVSIGTRIFDFDEEIAFYQSAMNFLSQLQLIAD